MTPFASTLSSSSASASTSRQTDTLSTSTGSTWSRIPSSTARSATLSCSSPLRRRRLRLRPTSPVVTATAMASSASAIRLRCCSQTLEAQQSPVALRVMRTVTAIRAAQVTRSTFCNTCFSRARRRWHLFLPAGLLRWIRIPKSDVRHRPRPVGRAWLLLQITHGRGICPRECRFLVEFYDFAIASHDVESRLPIEIVGVHLDRRRVR